MSQIQKVLKDALGLTQGDMEERPVVNYLDDTELALNEAKAAVAKIFEGADSIELEVQNQQIRKLQHEFIESYGLKSTSVGEEGNRRVKIIREK